MKNVRKSNGKFSNNKTRIQINHETGCSLRARTQKKKKQNITKQVKGYGSGI